MGDTLPDEVAGSSARSFDVTCSVNDRNSSSYLSNGIEDDIFLDISIIIVVVVVSLTLNEGGGRKDWPTRDCFDESPEILFRSSLEREERWMECKK